MERKTAKRWTQDRLPRVIFGAVLAAGLVCSTACQTPPKKPNAATQTVRHAGSTNSRSSSAPNSLDLFSSSAELFGTDPRDSRPALVSTTAFAAVGGAALLLAGAVVVSAARAVRGRTSSRHGRSRSA